MPRHTEPSANNALGNLLQGMLGNSTVRSENTQVIQGHPGMRPDILITALGRSPVVIESEYLPAVTVEEDARSRLGLELTVGGRIEACIALRYPAEVGDAHDLSASLASSELDYCVLTGSDTIVRFPESGWLEGSVTDLADLVRLASVPQSAVDQAANYLEQGIAAAAQILDDMHLLRPGITDEIAKLLGMHNVPQTRRMASAIVANALIFHSRIAGMHPGIKPLSLVCGDDISDPQGEILSSWKDILDINYYPIFAIGRDIVSQMPAGEAARVLRRLRLTAGQVNGTGVNNAHDLTGRVFQRLISDRKYLATFYTLPASAVLLARLSVAKMNDVDWASPDSIGELRIGDFACGTGALLSAVYEQIAARHESAGGDTAAIHPMMMEEVLYGCDVMPSAIHITGSTLAGIQPEVGYEQSRLYTMPYGRQDDGTVRIGSLELLQSSEVLTLFNTSDPALRTGSAGEETAAQVNVEIPSGGFDLVIMNPPFTSNTSNEGIRLGTFNASFAAFNTSELEQREMGKRLANVTKNTCYHGNAGLASAFAALGHLKLKPRGVLALVLPLTATAGLSWQQFRRMLTEHYTEISVLSIAVSKREMAFSSDTDIAECLIIAKKLGNGDPHAQQVKFTSLRRRSTDLASATVVADGIVSSTSVRSIKDGPYGGTPLMVGDEHAGEMLNAPSSSESASLSSVRLSDCSVAQTAYALSDSGLWLPGMSTPIPLKVVALGAIGKLGLVHHDINGPEPRGPFDKVAASETASYPSLWNHDAKKETRLICAPDSQLIVRKGLEHKASAVWSTASRVHLNRDYTFGSQPLAVAFTDRRSMGGRAWPNCTFNDLRFDYPLALWGNSSLGLLAYWWNASRQQPGRGVSSIRSFETLPILDSRTLSDAQLATAEGIFDEFRELDLMPAYLADADPNRALLDRRVICDLLGFGEEVYRGVRRLAQKWCAEPSVHGGKARPKSAKYVE